MIDFSFGFLFDLINLYFYKRILVQERFPCYDGNKKNLMVIFTCVLPKNVFKNRTQSRHYHFYKNRMITTDN